MARHTKTSEVLAARYTSALYCSGRTRRPLSAIGRLQAPGVRKPGDDGRWSVREESRADLPGTSRLASPLPPRPIAN